MLQASDEPNQRQYNTVRDQDGNGRKLLHRKRTSRLFQAIVLKTQPFLVYGYRALVMACERTLGVPTPT